jgi:hypothetical protein
MRRPFIKTSSAPEQWGAALRRTPIALLLAPALSIVPPSPFLASWGARRSVCSGARFVVVSVASGISALARDQAILSIDDLTAAIDAEALGDPAAVLHFSGVEVDGFAVSPA